MGLGGCDVGSGIYKYENEEPRWTWSKFNAQFKANEKLSLMFLQTNLSNFRSSFKSAPLN